MNIFGGKKAQEQRERIISYKRVFGTPEGKAVLLDLMDRNYVLDEHGADPIKEGRRAVVLEIIADCRINLAEFDKLLKGDLDEHNDTG